MQSGASFSLRGHELGGPSWGWTRLGCGSHFPASFFSSRSGWLTCATLWVVGGRLIGRLWVRLGVGGQGGGAADPRAESSGPPVGQPRKLGNSEVSTPMSSFCGFL